MSIIVQKFGGTSVADIKLIKNAAYIVKAEMTQGNMVAVVVSAMAKITDGLVRLTRGVSDLRNESALAEYDAILSTGEQVSAGLLALYLQSVGLRARSWNAWQLGIDCDGIYSDAKIRKVRKDLLLESFARREVPVITGFQGLAANNRICTFGRGGSDITAVALAAALRATRCDIYSDVKGVYSADPNIIDKASKLQVVSYEEMLEFSSLGAKVLQTRAAELALKYNVPVKVLSSLEEGTGTLIVRGEEVESKSVTGIAISNDLIYVSVDVRESDVNKIIHNIYSRNISLDMMNKVKSDAGYTISFATDQSCRGAVELALKGDVNDVKISSSLAKVSVIGAGIRNNPGILQSIFELLTKRSIKFLAISTTEIKISLLILEEYKELTARSLHTNFGLDSKLKNTETKEKEVA
jgi:aspartate kinase